MEQVKGMNIYEMESLEMSLDSLGLITEFNSLRPNQVELHHQEYNSKNENTNMEMEKLKIELENSRTESILLKSSNEGLKVKIGELFQEAQTNLQEKLKLENSLKDIKCQLTVIENSSKWYQARLHESEAINKSLRSDVDSYEKILILREQNINNLTLKSDEFDKLLIKYQNLESKYKKDHKKFAKELDVLRDEKNSPDLNLFQTNSVEFHEESQSESSKKIEDLIKELEIWERRFSNSETSKNLAETSLSDCRKIIDTLETNLRKNEIEKTEILEKSRIFKNDCEGLRTENERLRISLLSTKKEQCQVEEGIIQLRLQLTKMIAQYKSLKSRNFEAEKKLSILQEVEKENKQLKCQTVAIKNSLLRKIKEEKRKSKIVESLLNQEREKESLGFQREKTVNSMRICLQQTLEREKELKEKLRNLSKGGEESIDEGYGDGPGLFEITLTSPTPLNSHIIDCAAKLVNRSQNFLGPLQIGLDEIKMKIEKFGECKCIKTL